MKGFKSFGEKTELVFDSNFSCILGPNGSGKSNVGDALCFVLGKGSAKGMRAEKSANLIYNGGKTKNPAKSGEVSIFFDNSSKIFPADTDIIKLTRTIKNSGQSIYRINDKRRTRHEIRELLSIANIDPDGYNVILQGDIVRFVEMSTNDRRLVIEDIAGIGVYEEKKKKALKELEKVETRLNEAEIILTERKTYLKELKKERDQAAKYKELGDKINRNKATYLKARFDTRNKKIEQINKYITNHQDNIDKMQEKINKLKQDVVTNKEGVRQITKEVEQKGEKEQVEMLKVIEKLKVDVASDKNRISTCENELQRVSTRKDQLNASFSEIESKIKELSNETNEINKEKARVQKDISLIESKIQQFRKKNKLDGAEGIDKEIETIDKEAEEKQKEIQELREKQQNLLREKDKVEYQIHSIDEKINKVLEVEKQNKGEIQKLKQMKEEFKKATSELNKCLNEDSNLAAQIGNARDKLSSAQSELAKLNAKNTSIKESAALSIGIKSILDNKKKLGNVFGTVSELGKVKSKFALALEIAAGSRLKSIVVDNDKTASDCIKYLKNKKLGTATFLPLNKIKAPKEVSNIDSLKKANGVYGKAVDLVDYDNKFRNVFKYIYGSTLVVDNIDVARRIGIGSTRMVTLDGDMTELSGAMHGGFRDKKRASLGFQEKEVVEDINKNEKIVGDLTRLMDVLQKKRNENEQNITRLRTFKANLEGDIITKEKSLHLESGDLDASRNLKKDLSKQVDEYGKKLMQDNMKISACNKSLAELKIKKQQLRGRISELRNPRLIAELNTFEQKRGELKETVMTLDGNLKNINMQTKNILSPEQNNILKILKQHDKEEEGFREEIKDLKEKIKLEEVDLKEKEKLQKQFYGQFKGLFQQREKLNEIIQKLENKIIILEENIRATEGKKNTYSIENAKIKAELAGIEEEYKRYEKYPVYTNKSEEQLKKEIWEFERMVERLGNVNLKALEIYDSVEKEYNRLLDKKNLLLKEKDVVFVMINEIETKKTELFMKTFEIINEHFKEMFKAISSKGEAFLDLENPKDPLSEGVRIKVRISGKKFLDIRSLSGGEKTMTALAFIFAIQEHEPASFYIFDEVDAALDKHNSDKLSKLIKNYTDKAQYIIITHNDGLISEADTLYGVSMTSNSMSKVVSLKV